MNVEYPLRLLLVDDQPLVLSGLLAILEASNFTCHTANDGFQALAILRETLPDVIITDLTMPNMSGFELLAIVQQRFPQIAVIILSGEYIVHLEDSTHAFFRKGQYAPEQLIAKIRELHSQWPTRSSRARLQHPPLWVHEPHRKYLVVTCTDCLRSSPVNHATLEDPGVHETDCPSCGVHLTYFVDSIQLEVPLSAPHASADALLVRA
ncbi:MAG TPA: response regulator [Acidobacteriaceae bacterium]